eukprot:scaffold126924_cov69-Phaeocystis_antarctica.AAC.1
MAQATSSRPYATRKCCAYQTPPRLRGGERHHSAHAGRGATRRTDPEASRSAFGRAQKALPTCRPEVRRIVAACLSIRRVAWRKRRPWFRSRNNQSAATPRCRAG